MPNPDFTNTTIQQVPPPASSGARRTLTLPVENIHPVVRIAHRLEKPLNIAERIIFDYELVLIVAGAGELITEQHSTHYHAHDLLLIHPFAAHRFVAAADERHAHIAVHFDFAPGVPARREGAERRPYHVQFTHNLALPDKLTLAAGHRVEDAFLNLLRAWRGDDPLAPLAASHHLLSIILVLLRVQPAPKMPAPFAAQNQARMESVVAFIHSHLTETLTADALAQVAGLSASRLNTLFRQHTGYSPMDYTLRARVEEARRLLADIRLSVKEIAARAGFHDTYHFSRAFRHIDGLSPQHYRDALLAGRAHSDNT